MNKLIQMKLTIRVELIFYSIIRMKLTIIKQIILKDITFLKRKINKNNNNSQKNVLHNKNFTDNKIESPELKK